MKIKKSDSESDSDAELEARKQRERDATYLSIEQFCKLTIPKDVMKDGMIFIWVEKEYIAPVIKHLETQNFSYVENVCFVEIKKDMANEVRDFGTIDATPAIINDDYTYLKKSHKTLLMFRR